MKNGIIYMVESGLLTSDTGALKVYRDFADSGDYIYANSYGLAPNLDPVSAEVYFGEMVYSGQGGTIIGNQSAYTLQTLLTADFVSGRKYRLHFKVPSIVSPYSYNSHGIYWGTNTPSVEIANINTAFMVGSTMDRTFVAPGTTEGKIFALTVNTVPTQIETDYENLTLEEIFSELIVRKHDMGSSSMSTVLDFSGIIEESGLNLLGNRYNSESGIASYIKINEVESIYSGNDFTFLMEGGKLSRESAKEIYDFTGFDRQLPFHNKEIIFSNITGSESSYSGWEFGLNGANLFYFRTNDLGQQKILTFDRETPMGENIWAVRYSKKNIEILRYDPETETVNSNAMGLGGELKNGGAWYLNSGNLPDLSSPDTGNSSAFTSATRLNKFLYFSEFLSDDQIKIASEYMGIDVSGNVPYISDSGYLYSLQQNSGYSETSGELYRDMVYTGMVLIDSGIITGDAIYTTGTGFVPSGSGYLDFYDRDTGMYYTVIATADIPNAITGFDFYYPTSGWAEYTSGFAESIVSGIVDSGWTTGITEIEAYYEATGYTTGKDVRSFNNLFAESYSYLGQRNDEDFTEIVLANSVFRSGEKIINNQMQKFPSSYSSGYSLRTEFENLDNLSSMAFYFNGSGMEQGSGVPIYEIDNGIQYLTFGITGDYIVTGNQEVFTNILMTEDDQISSLYGVYDIITGDRERLSITGLDQYVDMENGDGFFSQITVEGRDIFFNGEKIYLERDYDSDGGYFVPRAELKTKTGLYVAWPKINSSAYYTGQSVYDIYGSGYLIRNSVATWINGIRKNPSEYLYHDFGADLISGRNLAVDFGSGVFEGEIEV